jgi:hypothetical protein
MDRSTRIVAGLLIAAILTPASGFARIRDWNPTISPANFTNSLDITNDYLPLRVGCTLHYEGQSKDGLETLDIAVTSQTRTVMGIQTRVVTETHRLNGQIVEVSQNYFAQDNQGTVWYFGEFSQTYENGVPVNSAGSWEAGVGDALPGIIMEANPQHGDQYFQEFAEGVAQDQAQVMSLTDSATVPYGTFGSVLRTKEWTRLEPASREKKFYAPGVGLIIDDNLQLVSASGC